MDGRHPDLLTKTAFVLSVPLSPQSSPPRPTPSSRIALSALVNSPTRSPPRSLPASRSPGAYTNGNGHGRGHGSGHGYGHGHDPVRAHISPYRAHDVSPQHGAYDSAPPPPRPSSSRELDRQYAPYEPYRYAPHGVASTSAVQPAHAHAYAPAPAHAHTFDPRPSSSAPVPGSPSNRGPYDPAREREQPRRTSATSAADAPVAVAVAYRPEDSLNANEEVWKDYLRVFQQRREREALEIAQWAQENVIEVPAAATEPKQPVKRKGWPADHPTRIAQREAREAARANAIANGVELPKQKRQPRKSKGGARATLDDELLDLAGDDAKPAVSSPLPGGPPGDDDGSGDDEAVAGVDEDPNSIILPCGLPRHEVMSRVQSGNIGGLSEDDVKQVQDEIWRAAGKSVASFALRKDGTARKKPGPAKGWKAMRREQDRRDRRARGEPVSDSEPEAASVAGDEAESDIAALLEDEGRTPKRGKKKRRKLEGGAEEVRDEDDEDDDGESVAHSIDDRARGKKRAAQDEADVAPEDPRGVSEHEAERRLELVEELQRQTWQSIVRDVPRIYRVNQAFDNAARQDSSRKAALAVRNAFTQRTLKLSYRSAARVNKDAAVKAKKVIREMLVYWRRNEKDELAARKKAEKEALERAKAEEEAREAKRQARKLNFLLTQTELYSHFIGKKIKTHEAENMDDPDGPTAAQLAAPSAPEGAEHINDELGLDDNGEPLPDIDYDDDDEENLRRHAAKGAQAAIQAARDKARAFDDQRNGPAVLEDDTMDGDELNFQNPSMGDDQVTITQPKMLMAQLKEYQLKGLTWLGNLYEQGINGILADEMGLGKTIQSISLLAYLAEHHNLWGPFLVIAPASTLHNWQQELTRFVPRLKALPYWGSPKDRETLRRIWNRKNVTFTEDSPFHILVTSYQMAVVDEKYFQMMRWQYMILDEAQAIKSSSSARWKSLLSLHCRNRLLLTGTPIQNSMHELWALLHFIMPSLFDSHEEFSEWFSKDIENAAGGGSTQLQPEQLKRLHMILKPFMLRRVKKHVQKELGDKIEIDVLVDLSQRQRTIYKALRQRVSVADLIAQANNTADSAGVKSLMNLVMQFRKVCNHPDLFERADVVSPFVFGSFAQSGNLARQPDVLYCPDSARNAIGVRLPRLLVNEHVDVPAEDKPGRQHTLQNLLNIWDAGWIHEQSKEGASEWGFLKLMGWDAGEASKRARRHPLVEVLAENDQAIKDVDKAVYQAHGAALPIAPRVPPFKPSPSLPALREIAPNAWEMTYLSRSGARFTADRAIAPRIKPVASDRAYLDHVDRVDLVAEAALYGLPPSGKDDARAASAQRAALHVGPLGLLGQSRDDQIPPSVLRVPPIKRLIVDSAKLARLDELLRELKQGGHRVLLYFQMTRMMDLIEEYLVYRQYRYLRLDGSSPIGERRDMVTSWQTNPDIFIFCLSTRAGGLGINLTAADTVIFYDHDWNPSNDAQAMDRAHRVGQTRQVTVYRLIARGTIEERVVKLARAKKDVQDIVVGSKALTDVAKPAEIVSLFMDDDELQESVAKRRQAEAHGYVAPAAATARARQSAFGDGLGANVDDDDDDFFSLRRRPANEEDDDDATAAINGAASGTATPAGPKKRQSRKKAENEPPKKRGKKVKIKVGPDGLPARERE
ncbi:putative DNA helicase ino80 [Cryptotrichosporon argae]